MSGRDSTTLHIKIRSGRKNYGFNVRNLDNSQNSHTVDIRLPVQQEQEEIINLEQELADANNPGHDSDNESDAAFGMFLSGLMAGAMDADRQRGPRRNTHRHNHNQHLTPPRMPRTERQVMRDMPVHRVQPIERTRNAPNQTTRPSTRPARVRRNAVVPENDNAPVVVENPANINRTTSDITAVPAQLVQPVQPNTTPTTDTATQQNTSVTIEDADPNSDEDTSSDGEAIVVNEVRRRNSLGVVGDSVHIQELKTSENQTSTSNTQPEPESEPDEDELPPLLDADENPEIESDNEPVTENEQQFLNMLQQAIVRSLTARPVNEEQKNTVWDITTGDPANPTPVIMRSGDATRQPIAFEALISSHPNIALIRLNRGDSLAFYKEIMTGFDNWIRSAMRSNNVEKVEFLKTLDKMFGIYLLKFPRVVTNDVFVKLVQFMEEGEPNDTQLTRENTEKLKTILIAIKEGVLEDITKLFDTENCRCARCAI